MSFQFLFTSRRKYQFDARVPLTSLKLWFIFLINKETRCLRIKAFCRQCYLDRSQIAVPVSNRKLMLQSITRILESSFGAGPNNPCFLILKTDCESGVKGHLPLRLQTDGPQTGFNPQICLFDLNRVLLVCSIFFFFNELLIRCGN